MAIDRSVNAPATCPDLITKTVYYAGSDEVKEGEPFVYTTGAGTASATTRWTARRRPAKRSPA